MLFRTFRWRFTISLVHFIWTIVLTARRIRIVLGLLSLSNTDSNSTNTVRNTNVFSNFVVHKIIHSMHTTPVRNYAKREIPFKIQNNSLAVWEVGSWIFCGFDKWPKTIIIFDNSTLCECMAKILHFVR